MKMRKETLGAFIFLCLLPAPLCSQTTMHEAADARLVRIDMCRIVPNRKTDVVPSFGGLHISYANTSERTANRVDFDVTYAGATQRVVDYGRFSHDAEIRHRFNAFRRYPIVVSNPTCFVSSVHFLNAEHDADAQKAPKKKKRHHFWLFFWWW